MTALTTSRPGFGSRHNLPFYQRKQTAYLKAVRAAMPTSPQACGFLKPFWNGEWIFEAALCNACEKALSEGYSEASLQNLADWSALTKRPPHLQTKLLNWCNCFRCAADVAIRTDSTFHLTAWIEDGDIFWAYSLCEACLLEAEHCYSDETRGHRDRFIGKLQPVPADLLNLESEHQRGKIDLPCVSFAAN